MCVCGGGGGVGGVHLNKMPNYFEKNTQSIRQSTLLYPNSAVKK